MSLCVTLAFFSLMSSFGRRDEVSDEPSVPLDLHERQQMFGSSIQAAMAS